MGQGDLINFKIDSIAAGGEGVGRVGGKAIFVESGIPGDEIQAEIVQGKQNYSRAKIRSFIKRSCDRAEPPCKYFSLCGACQLQHINYDAQLKFKTRIVKDTVKRIGNINEDIVADIVGMDDPWGYRNKMQYPVNRIRHIGKNTPQRQNPGISMGYFKKGTHDVVDIDRCVVLHPFLNEIAAAVREGIKAADIPAYNEDTRTGLIRHILSRIGFYSGEALLTFIVNQPEIQRSKKLIGVILDRLKMYGGKSRLVGISKNINQRRTNIILGDRTYNIWGKDHITEKLNGLRFNISATSFFQVNTKQAIKLYSAVEKLAGLTGEETVLDAYCGTGSIALWLAGKAGEVHGIEEIPGAISDAKENARANGIKNAFFKCGKVEKTLETFIGSGMEPGCIVLDPPRAGCAQKVLDIIKIASPKTVIYVSCDPATLSRDIAILCERDQKVRYETEIIQPVDMFPHTSHIECVAKLVRTR